MRQIVILYYLKKNFRACAGAAEVSVVTETRPISIHFKQLRMKLKIGKSDTAEVDVVKGIEIVDDNADDDAPATLDTSLCANGNGEDTTVRMVTDSNGTDAPK